MIFTLEELALFLGSEPSMRPGPSIEGVKPLEFARDHDITFVTGSQFLGKLDRSAAAAVILPPELAPHDMPYILANNPEAAFARLTALYYPYPEATDGVSPRAEVHPDAVLGQGVSVGPFAVVGRAAVIGTGSVVGAHAVVGEEVRIGSHTRIFPHVTIYARVRIGDRAIIHSGTVIGSDGFGFAREVDETRLPVYEKKYHSGTVEIGDDVEIESPLRGRSRVGRGDKYWEWVQAG